jgi:VIT1/CCC1 family predicted Fe2+/Mn2+ transporter
MVLGFYLSLAAPSVTSVALCLTHAVMDKTAWLCVAATGLVFFVIGAIKSRLSPSGWLRSGIETLLIGMSAAGISYAIGYALKILVHVSI